MSLFRGHVGGLVLALALPLTLSAPAAAAPVGPKSGELIIVGGGTVGPEILDRFFAAAGGKNAPIVVIPTANGADSYDNDWRGLRFLKEYGATNIIVMHTNDRKVADSDAFVAPLKTVKGVWIPGGRQWRLADSYNGTKTEAAIKDLLARGGVVGGTSAGASIQADYLVRGAVEGNEIMISPGHEVGFGLITNVAIDQHVNTRNRQMDLQEVIKKHPRLTGIGMDESTGILVKGDQFEVIGKGHVYLHDRQVYGDKPYRTFDVGDKFTLSCAGKANCQ